MSKTTMGWLFVAIQAVLLIVLIVLPGRDDWAVPVWLNFVASVFTVGGMGLVLAAAFRLGRALTPTPVPTASGELTTTGLYRFVRHPIYSGVLAIVVGLVLRSGSWVTLAVGSITVIFFNVKASWEESQLTATYPDYPEYASRTPRFVPRPGQR